MRKSIRRAKQFDRRRGEEVGAAAAALINFNSIDKKGSLIDQFP